MVLSLIIIFSFTNLKPQITAAQFISISHFSLSLLPLCKLAPAKAVVYPDKRRVGLKSDPCLRRSEEMRGKGKYR